MNKKKPTNREKEGKIMNRVKVSNRIKLTNFTTNDGSYAKMSLPKFLLENGMVKKTDVFTVFFDLDSKEVIYVPQKEKAQEVHAEEN